MAALNNQQKWLVVVGNEGQAVEDALQQIYSGYWIDDAVGSQLDVLGDIVGQRRGGMADADYRRLIRARISVNRSKGTVEDVLKVARLVVNDDTVTYEVDNQGYATVVLRLLGAAVDSDLVRDLLLPMLRSTVAAGVRIIVEWSDSPPSEWLIWDVTDWDDYEWVWVAD